MAQKYTLDNPSLLIIKVVNKDRNSTYGNYEYGPAYNSAVDNNPRYGEDVNNWEGGVVTDVNLDYQALS